ncbi:hypothetical protein MPSEU_000184400 [Mayamaea pseudoterrestris]|nr:hypothetical protein MPSEU_000184400 [Mayamaea pseudoterrestris]
MISTFRWSLEKNLQEFIDTDIPRIVDSKQHHQKPLDAKVELVIDNAFVKQYSRLGDDDINKLLSALSVTPLDAVCLDGKDIRPAHPGRRRLLRQRRRRKKARGRWNQLFKCIGEIPTMVSATIKIGDFPDPRFMFDDVIRFLSKIVSINVWEKYYMAEFHIPRIRALARGLSNHPSIRKVNLLMHPRVFSIILPALETMPLLERVVIDAAAGIYTMVVMQPEQAQALAGTLTMNRPIDLKIEGINLTDHEGSFQVFLDAITNMTVQGLELASIIICVAPSDVREVAQALTGSTLRKLCLGSVEFYNPMDDVVLLDDTVETDPNDSLPEFVDTRETFLTNFVQGLPTMHHLYELDIMNFFGQDVSLRVAQAAIQCRHLQVLKLSVHDFTISMDEALAECVRTNPNLETIELDCVVGLHKDPPFAFPALLGALRSNYTMKNIHLSAIMNRHQNTWDSDMLTEMNTLLRLNCSGRGGLEHDPGNLCKVVRIIEQVNDDAYCVFVLLRENLFVFGSRSAQPAGIRTGV